MIRIKYIFSFYLSLLLLLFNSTLKAQGEHKYKDVFEFITTQSEEEAYSLLRSFQKQDPFHANAYYQLGVISQKWAKKYDPLTEYANLSHFAYHADLYLNLCLKYLDEKEAKKNWKYYNLVKTPEGKKRPDFEDITGDVKNRIADINNFKSHIDTIRNNYLGIVDNYNKCLEIFLDINAKNNKLKDIYLLADNKLLKQIDSLKKDYDSTLIYFDSYKNAIASFPIKDYNQNYETQEIETYRLHGLTNSDFLEDSIVLWNYKSWVEDVLNVINNDIESLRTDINATSKEMDGLSSLLNLSIDYTRSYDKYKIPDPLIFKIGKYDYQSIILDLFYYDQQKINLIIKSKDPYNNPEYLASRNFNAVKYLNYYYEFINEKLEAENLLGNFEDNLSVYKLNKYKAYFEDNYKSLKGVNNSIDNESKAINSLIDNSMETLKTWIASETLGSTKEQNYIIYKNASIPCFVEENDLTELRPNQFYTNKIKYDADKNIYLSGLYNPAEGNEKAFIVKSDSTFKLLWYKEVDKSTSTAKLNNRGMQLELTGDGCIAIINSFENPDSTSQNYFIRYNSNGKEILSKEIGPKLVPGYFLFDDINEKMLIVYYKKNIYDKDSLREMTIDYTDSTGFILWKAKIQFQGNIVDIIKTNDNYLFVGNYSKLIDKSGKLIQVQGNTDINTNAFSVFIKNGDVDSYTIYPSEKSYYLTKAIKLNSEVANLVGLQGFISDRNKISLVNKSKLEYRLINVNGKQIFNY